MFESLVADILVKYIGEYIKNLSSEQLKVNIFSGNVVLKNLEIKGEALQSFKLPLHVQKGIIGTLELKIPWTNLKSMPVILEIDSICLYAIPQTRFEYNEEEERVKQQQNKQKKLEKYEMIRAWKEGGGLEGNSPTRSQDGFMSNVMSKILNNIEVKINTFHLRYEEVRNGKIYSLGLSFGSLSAYSTDSNYSKQFNDHTNSSNSNSNNSTINNDSLYKYVELSDFSIYLNSDDQSISNLSNEEFQRRLKSMTGTDERLGEHRYILKPITVTLKVEINKNLNMDQSVPKMKVQCQFEEVCFDLEENQYQTILKLLTTIGAYAQELKYLKYRPKLRPKQDPRAWWRYFAEVYREPIREKIQQRSWNYMQKRRQNRKEYVSLFKKSQGVEWLDAIAEKETKRIQEMEEFLSFEDIIYFRSLARRELAKEQAIADSKKGEYYSSVNRTKSFFGFWKANEPKMSIQLTKEQQEEIYKSMEYDEVALSATIEMPPDYIQNVLQVKVEAIVFTIIGSRKGEDPLMISYLNNISFTMSQRQQGVRFNLDLESFNVIDHYNTDSLFPYVITSTPRYKCGNNNKKLADLESPINNVRYKNNINNIDSSNNNNNGLALTNIITNYNNNINNNNNNANHKHNNNNNHLFNITFETNPISSQYDYKLSLILNTMEIIVNKPQIERLIEFATPKENVNLFPLSSVAMEELILLKEMTIFQLREVINHHKTIDIYVDAKAPTVIIPEHANRSDTTLIIVDLGSCLMHSDLSQKSAKVKENIDRPLLLTEMESVKESDLYDHYRASMSSIKVMLARNDQQWWNTNNNNNNNSDNTSSIDTTYGFPLIEEMAINLHIQSCIEPSELSMALFKVSGTLPEVKINISDSSYLQLYRMSKTLAAESTHSSNAYNQLMDTLYTTKQQSDTVVDVSLMEIKLSEAYRQVLAKRKIFEGEFTLQRVLVDVHSSNIASASIIPSGGSSGGINSGSHKLIQLRINELQLSLKKKTYDYYGTLLLAEMEIEDCLESNKRFSSLVTSQSRHHSTETKKLISISHHIIEKDSPDYSGIDTDIDFNFGELNMNYNPKSIGQVLTFLDYCFEETYKVQEELIEQQQLDSDNNTDNSTNSNDLVLQSPKTTSLLNTTTSIPPPSSNAASLSVIRAKAHVHALSVSLNDDGHEVAMFSINKFVIRECTLNGREIEIDGLLESITIESYIDSEEPFKILTPKNQEVSMATFKYKSFNNRSANKSRDFDTEIDLDLRSIRVTVLVDFILKTKSLVQLPFKTVKYASLYRYQTEYNNNNNNNNSISSSSDDISNNNNNNEMEIIEIQKEDIKVKKTNYRIFLESPQIILSSSDSLSTTDDKIISELGSIEISTVLKKSMEKNLDGIEEEVEWQVINATLSDMNMKTVKSGKHHQVLHNLSINTSIEQLLCWSKTQKYVSKTLVPLQQSIRVGIKEIALEFQDLEHSLIFTITKDVIEKISARAKEKQSKKLEQANSPTTTAILNRKKSTGIDNLEAITSIVNIDIEKFTLLLQLEDYNLAQITVSNINVCSQTNKVNESTFNGLVQSAQLVDMRPHVKDVELFESIFTRQSLSNGNSDQPMLKFSFISHQQRSVDGWDSELMLQVEPARINASVGFLFSIKDFFLLPFSQRLSKYNRENPHQPDFDIPTLDSLDITGLSRMKLMVTLKQPIIQLPVSPHSTEILEMAVGQLELTNRYIDWNINQQDIPVESMMISLTNINITSSRHQISTTTDSSFIRKPFTKYPFNLSIDYQSLESIFTNTIDVLSTKRQPTTVSLNLTPIALSIDESDFGFFIDMVAQAFRSLDDNPPLKLKKKDPYLLELFQLRKDQDQLEKTLDIYGMQVDVNLQSIVLELLSHIETQDPFSTVIVDQCKLQVDMATVPKEKKMFVKGNVKQLRVFDDRTQLNHDVTNSKELVFHCVDPVKNMMEFTYLSLNSNHEDNSLLEYSSDLHFNLNGLFTYGHPAFLLRVWDFVVVSFTSVFGTYSTDKYSPEEPIIKPNDSRMRMNVYFDKPLIVLRQSYDESNQREILYVEPDNITIINRFTKLSEIEAMTIGSEYSDAMIVTLNNTSLVLRQQQQQQDIIASNYNIEITMESKPEIALGDISSNASQSFTIKTNDLKLSCTQIQFDKFYRCLNHALECQYQLDHEYQKRFLKPGHIPTKTDMFAAVEVDSIIVNLLENNESNNKETLATMSFSEFKIDSAILEPGMTVTGSLSKINLKDIKSDTHLIKPHGSEYATLFFTYKSHNERTLDGWDAEFEATIKNILLVPFPLSLLNDIKQFFLNPLTDTPLAQRPPIRSEQSRMKLSAIIKDSRVMLYDPERGPSDHLLFSVDCLEMHNTIDPQKLAESTNCGIVYDLERWKYDIEGLSMSLHRDGEKTTRLLSNLELTANTDTIRDYDTFVNSFQELDDSLQLELPPNVKTNIEIQELNLTLSKSNYRFLMELYNTYLDSTNKSSSSSSSSQSSTSSSDEAAESELLQSIVANLVSLKMNSFSVVLIDGIYGLAEVAFYDFDTIMSIYRTSGDDGATEVSGSLHRLQFIDQRRQSCQSRYKRIVNSTFDSKIQFNFRPSVNDPTWKQKLDVKCENLILTPLFDLFSDVQEYLKLEDNVVENAVEVKDGDDLLITTTTTTTTTTTISKKEKSKKNDNERDLSGVSRLKYDIVLNGTKLIIPMNIEMNFNYLSGDIQEIQLSNAFVSKTDLDIDQLSCKITGMSMNEHIETSLEMTRILSDLNMDITMKNNIYDNNSKHPDQPLTNIIMDVGNIHMSFTPGQYIFFYNMMNLTLYRYYEWKFGPYPDKPLVAPQTDDDAEHSGNDEDSVDESSDPIEMNVIINIQLLKLVMNIEHYPASELTLKRLAMDVDISKKKMIVDGVAKDLIINSISSSSGSSNNPNGSLYNDLLMKLDKKKEFFTFKYISHAATEPVEWDTEFLINLRSIHLISMIGTLTRIRDFLMEPLAIPIVSPPNALTRGRPSKMKQVINMEPWTLFIPATDYTSDAVIIQFGSTCMTNFYRDVTLEENKQESTHPVEVLQLTISKLSLFSEREGNRVSISNQASCFIEIEKLFAVNNKKDHLRTIEDQRMLVKIPSLELIFSQEDYRFFYYIFTSDWMRFASSNIIRPPIPPPTPQFNGLKFVYVSPDHTEQMEIAEHQFESPLGFIDLTRDTPRQMTVYTEIGRISMAISQIDPILDPIASLEINHVNVNYLLYRNNIVKTEMTVDTVQLVDERQSTDSVFKEILTRKKQTKKGDPQLLVESWVDSRRNRNFVSIHCDHPLLFVSPDSILPIMSFFTSIQQPLTKYTNNADQNKQLQLANQPSSPPNHFRFYLKVTKPKMLLVEDETQQNTRALVIKMPIEFHYSQTPEQNLTMELKAPKCQVFRTTPFTDTEGISSTPITNSFSFNFIYLHFSENEQKTVNIAFQPLNIFLSYKEMILINRIINNLSTKDTSLPNSSSSPSLASSAASSPTSTPPPTHRGGQSPNQHPNGINNKSLALTTFKSPIRPEDSGHLMHKTRVHLDFVGRVNLTLLDESHSISFQDIPFVQISMGDLSSDFWGWEDYSFITTSCLLKVEVFNYKHMAFDSLIEQFPLNIQVLKSDDPKLKISIKTENLVNINISHPFIASLAKFYENIQITNEKERLQQAQYQQRSIIIQQQQQQQQNQQQQQSSIDNDGSIPSIEIGEAASGSSSSSKPISIPSSPSKSSLSTFGSQNDLSLSQSRGSIEAVRWKKAEPNIPVVEKPSLSSSIIASTKRDSMKSSVIMTHFNTNTRHRRHLSGSINSQQLFNTVGQNLFWVVNLTGKDIQYYVEELQLVQPQPSANNKNTNNNNLRESSNPKLKTSYDPEEEAEMESRTKLDRAIHFLKNRDKQPLELNSVLFKTRDFRTHGNLNAHIAFRFTDSEEDQWIHGVSINMMGDNFYFPPYGNRANLIVCEVGWNESNDNKIATLRSPVIVRNSCTIPIDILIVSNTNEQTTFGPIAAGDNFYIPVDFFNYTSRISIRPSGHDFIFDMENALHLVDSSNWPTSHLFAPYKEDGSSSHGSSSSVNDYRSMLHYFYLATLVQPGIRCERTGLISTTLIICPPLIIENALYCDINVRVHSHTEVKRNKSDYNKAVQQHPPARIATGKQIPFYTHAEDDVGVTIQLNGMGKEQYLHLQYLLTTGSTTGFNVIEPTEDTGNFTQEVTYQCTETGYNLVLKIDHRFEGGCHIATIYTINAITNHTMIPFVLRPSIKGPKSPPSITLETDESEVMISHDKFTLSHPSFPDIHSREFDIILGKEDIIEIQLQGRDTMKLQFRVFVSTGNNIHFRTRRVDIYPRFCLVNKLPLSIAYTQFNKDMIKMTRDCLELQPDDQTPFYWFNGFDEQMLAVTIPHENEWRWSSGVRIDSVGTNYLKMTNVQDTSIEQVVKVEVVDSNESIMVFFYPTDPQLLPFHIINDTQLSISLLQKCPNAKRYVLKPNEDIYYTWDQPCADQQLLVLIENNATPAIINLNKIKAFKPIKFNQHIIFPVSQAANGSTRELTFSHHHEQAKVQDMIEFAIEFSFERLGFSIINDVPEELIYIQLKDCSFWYSTSNITHTTWVIIDDIQIDNQKPDTDYPVLLWCEKKLDGKCLPFLEFSAIKLNKPNFEYYDLIALYLNEMYVQIDDVTLINLHSFYSKLPLDKFYSTKGNAVEQLNMFYIKWLIVAEIKLYLTFSISRDGILSNYNKLPALRLLVPSLGKSLGQLENAPLTIAQLGIKNVFTTPPRLQEHLYSHYHKQMKRQIHILLGSSSVFGSPVVLFNTISTGMTEAIEEPLKGSILLMKRILYAAANSSAKLFGTISNGFAVWSMDETYLRRRDAEERVKAKHIGQGILLGTKGLALGFFDGLTGIVTQPVMGAINDGPIGLLKGIGKGVAGVAVKPVTGVFDFAARTSEGIRNNTNINPEKFRIRVPRYINPREPIREYSFDESEGNFLMRQNQSSIIKRQGVRRLEYKFHMILPDCTILLTSVSMICLSKKGSYRWSFPLTEIARIGHLKSEKSYLNIHLKRYLKFGKLGSSKKKIAIHCANESILIQLDTKIRSCLFKSYDIDLDAEENEDEDGDKSMVTLADKSTRYSNKL